MKINSKTTREELAAIITKAFSDRKMSLVLVGGSVVSIYTKNKYETDDLDFVSPNDTEEINSAMKELGFSRKGKDFEHPNTDFFVEFPARTLSIGETSDLKAEGRLKIKGTVIRLYSPTQCVMDRLAAFYHWNDTQSLEQAVMVATAQKINLKKIESWSRAEGEIEKFERFKRRLEK